MQTLAFPLNNDPLSGSLGLASGVEAARQTLSAWILANPGDYLYYWSYGANLGYNLPMTMAQDQVLGLAALAQNQHPWVEQADVRIIPDQENILNAILYFRVAGQEGMVGVRIGG